MLTLALTLTLALAPALTLTRYAPAEHTMGVACQYGDAEGGLP